MRPRSAAHRRTACRPCYVKLRRPAHFRPDFRITYASRRTRSVCPRAVLARLSCLAAAGAGIGQRTEPRGPAGTGCFRASAQDGSEIHRLAARIDTGSGLCDFLHADGAAAGAPGRTSQSHAHHRGLRGTVRSDGHAVQHRAGIRPPAAVPGGRRHRRWRFRAAGGLADRRSLSHGAARIRDGDHLAGCALGGDRRFDAGRLAD